MNKEIGERIRTIRERARLTQEAIGEILGVEKATISRYEAGDSKKLSPESLFKLAGLGQVSIDWLITGKEPERKPEPEPAITYPLGEEEKMAVTTAENLLKYSGLEKRFAVVEIHHPPAREESLSEEETRLLTAFRSLDRKIQEALLIQAEMTAEGLKKSEKKEPQGGGLMEAI